MFDNIQVGDSVKHNTMLGPANDGMKMQVVEIDFMQAKCIFAGGEAWLPIAQLVKLNDASDVSGFVR